MCFPMFVCLFMPRALLLLTVSQPLTCSQSSGLFVLLVSPVHSPCLVHLCLIVYPALIVLTCPSLSVVCVYSPCFLVSRCVFINYCYMVCAFLFFLLSFLLLLLLLLSLFL